MSIRRSFAVLSALVVLVAVTMGPASGQTTDPARRGRKYKVPPATSHVEVTVVRGNNQKPIANAAVIFRSTLNGVDEGNLEVKTDEAGVARIDVIPTGSKVDVQVIADGYATYAENYQVDEPTRSIEVKMIRPRAQVSTYVDNRGKESERPVGVQEPNKPSTPPVVQTPQPTNHTSDPDPITPVSPNASPSTTQNPTPPQF